VVNLASAADPNYPTQGQSDGTVANSILAQYLLHYDKSDAISGTPHRANSLIPIDGQSVPPWAVGVSGERVPIASHSPTT
jgi:hypothetical protein